MSIQRPQHLVRRQVRGRTFGEDASLVTVGTTVNQFGEPASTETAADITCATAPASGNDARVRQLAEGGIALSAMRQFWMAEEPRPVEDEESEGDIIVWPRVNGERFRVRSVEPWGGFSAVVAVRIEGQ